MRKTFLFLPFLLYLIYFQGYSQEKPILIANGILINGLGGQALKGWDLLIKEGKITKIKKDIKAPKGTRIIDAGGKTILPGLIDMHGHLYALGQTQLAAYPLLYLAGGVTTLFSPGEFEPEKILSLKKAIQKGELIGPNIMFAGPYFDSRESSLAWTAGLVDSSSLIKQFDQWQQHIDGIKVYANISKQHFDLLMQKAKQQGLPVTGHLGTISTRYAIEKGIHGLEHGLVSIRDFGSNPNEYQNHLCHIAGLDLTLPKVSSLIALIVEHKVYIDPTLTVFESMRPTFEPLVDNLNEYLDQQAQLQYRSIQASLVTLQEDSCLIKALEKQAAFTRLIYLQGGLLVTGTDPVFPSLLPGYGIKREIKLLVEKAGIPLVKAIRIASYNGAIALGIAQEKGSLEVGKAADLSIIEGDITQNLDLLNNTYLVIKEGQLYDSKELLQSAKGKITVGQWGKRK